uniref:Hemagglutinin A n=13 Tax=Porphyromonas gingivalis TaxID=837 RepID=HAGA2_PORGN|nr:RecName: Full=Hemagglutinin A; Flags: Precursor [Porphyromonas gingivalis]AAB17128.1 hemagglutinin A [Porphyromonas gingivalis]
MRKLNSLFSLAVLLSLLCWGQTAAAQGGPKTAPSVTHQAVQKGIRTSKVKDLRDPIPAGMARIILEAHDVWEDGTGYQMLWDADHNQYGASIPEESFWFANGTIPAGLYDPFEYKVPVNADASFSPTNFVLDGTASADIPAGTYDYVIINPNPGIIYIVGEGVSKGNDYVVEAGKTYHFTVQRQGPGDAASVVVTGEGGNEFAPVQNLQWSVSGQTVTLTWQAPASDKRTYVLNESFDTQTLPNGWTMIDADGDGHNWLSTINVYNTATHTGDGAMFSKSWTASGGAKIDLSPDNYLVTPKVTVPENGKLSYWVSSQVPWTNEHYGVFLSTTGNEAANFTIKLLEETLGSDKPAPMNLVKSEGVKLPAPYQERTIDLSAYAGQQVYLAFRHFNSTGIFRLYLDDVAVSGEGSSNDYTYTVYRDNVVIAQNLAATTFNQENVAPGQYNYCVEVKYTAGVSPKVCKDVTVEGSNEFAHVQNLTGSAVGQKVTLKWDAPNGTPNPNPGTTTLSESFENGIPASWKTIDADGDGNNWTTTPPPGGTSFAGHNSAICASSASYINFEGPQNPDNYLVTPELSLPNGGTLTFWVCAQDANYASEHYAVYASSTGNDASNFANALLEEVLTAKTVVTAPEAIRGTRVQGTWYQKTVQLPAGTKYVAFRHFGCTDFFWINLDDVEIKANGKRADFTETFESSTHGEAPAEWTTIDADGDGQGWLCLSSGQLDWLTAHGGTNVVASFSWNGMALNPDNYLISKDVTGATKVKYYYAVNDGFPGDHYAVMISKTGTNAGDFTVVFEETPNGINKGGARFGLSTEADGAKPQSVWIERTVDLPAGTKYVAFRHYNCSDLNYILLDDIQFTMGGSPTPTDYTYTVYRDGTKIKEGLTETTFEEDGVATGNHEYCVEVKYTAGVSPKECVNVTVDPVQFNPVQNLTGSAVGQKVTLKWDAPNGTPNPNPNPNPGTTTLSESFENGIPASWKTIDADGDGNNWTTTPPPGGTSFAGHNSAICASSASYINFEGPQNPDNYLVTPELSLPNGGTLTFWVCAQDANYASEHYAVYASSTGNDASNFANALLEEVLTAKTVVTAPEAIRGTRVQGTWYQKTVQLPAGTKYVAFRHFGCTDFFWINLDDVEIKANGKRADFTETFESSTHGEAPAEWTTIDADGDGQGWLCLSSGQLGWLTAHGGTNVVASFSWNGMALNPDNYLISKDVTGATKVKYYYAVNDGFPGDHYAVMISKTGTNAGDFTVVFEETPNGINKGGARFGLSTEADGAKPQSVWIERTVDLPAGTKYVAFRHYNCSDLNYILLDDIQFTMGGSPTPTDYTYTVYRDGTKIKEGLTETTFEEDGVATGNHEYCVEVKYTAGVSPKECVNVTVDPVQFNPVQNLTGSAVGQKVTLKWDAPNGTPNPNPNPNPGTTTLSESFENGIPASWKTIDADGDGNNWTTTPPPGGTSFAGHNSAICASSASYINFEGPQNPDNYLVTPELSLPNGGTLTFWVCAQDANYASEHYAVYASSTGNDASNFANALLEEVLTAKTVVTAPEAIRGTRVQGTWYQKTVQLPAGTKYVAFRHFGCTDFFWINLDDVEIKANGKRADFTETFESSTHGEAPAEWTTIDADGDGQGWLCLSSGQLGWLTAHGGTNVVASFSWNGMALNPDNYLISKDVTGATKVKYYYAVNDGFPGDHYAVMISKTGTNAGDFTVVFEETPNGINKGGARFGLSTEADGAKPQSVWIERTVDLPAGTKYVAFRHYNCSDLNYILLDDIQFTMGGSPTPTDYTYTVYRDGTKIKEGLTETTFEEDGVATGNHEYCVEVKYTAGVSPKECVNVTVDPVQFNPVQNLTGSAVGQKVTLKWDAPNGTPNPNPNPNPGTTTLSESFENGIPASWKTIDADGDGNNWTTTPPPGGTSFAGHNSAICVSSASYINFEGPQNPDNYLVTPELSLPGGGTLTFWVCAQDANYASEHYAVYASSTGNDASNFANALLEEVLTAKTVVTAPEAIRGTRVQGTWYQKTVQLPAGTKYVAFRHFGCTDFFWINLDEVEIKANGKRADFTETFESSTHGEAPAEWTTIDADGDGQGWLCLSSGQLDWLTAHGGTNVVASFSWNGMALNPDNYLISKDVTGATKVKYYYAVNDGFPGDHYAVMISKTGTNAGDFTVVFEETPNGINKGGARFGLSTEADGAKPQSVWIERTVDLPAGTKYVAFRHYNCSDLNYILLDDIQFTMGGSPTPTDYTYTVYRDGTKIKEGLTETTFEEDGVATGNHEYCVEVKYTAGVSPKVCVNVTINPTQFNPVQNLTAEQAPNSMDAILKWNAPASKRAEVLNEDFENGIPSSWKTIDADGDGNNWTTTPPPGGSSFAGHNSAICVSSASYINFEGPQNPDNYLVTPELSLPGGGTLTFWVCAQDANYASEHYAVYASSTGNDASNFANALLEEVLTAKTVVTAPEAIRGTRVQGTWYQKTVQLPAGTKYVAFRHFGCTDFFWINLDDVVITSGNAPSYTYTIYRNNTQIASGVTETTYRDPDLATGFYTYGVKVVYPNGESAIETATLNITSLADVTAQKPYTLTVVGKTITVTCQGEAMIYDMNGRRLAAGRNTVVYTAQGGHYAVMVVVDGKSYVEKLAVK